MEKPDTIHRAMADIEKYAHTLHPDSTLYWNLHKKRFFNLCLEVNSLVEECRYHNWKLERVIDIGNSFQTILLEKLFPEFRMDTLGFLTERYSPVGGGSKHIEFDLNDAFFPEKWPAIESNEKYDLVLFLEVIEHLYTSPLQTLGFLKSILNPGGFILIGTPNAAALRKRICLLGGRNPYEEIRLVRDDPGHFREYTIDELCRYANELGFEVRWWNITNPYRFGARSDRLLDSISTFLPKRFREAISILIRLAPS
jgi:SAM-dependent methyltransferase